MIKLVKNPVVQPAVLCGLHKSLNPYVINHVLSLVKREVTVHLGCLDGYMEHLAPELKCVMRSIGAMKGMWWVPSAAECEPPVGAVRVQDNGCEACMLARVVSQPVYMTDLRGALLSRTRTRGSTHRAPRLLAFVDSAINRQRDAAELFYISGQVGFELKKARKQAARYFRSELEEYREREPAKSEHSIIVYLDPNAKDPSTGLEHVQYDDTGYDPRYDPRYDPASPGATSDCDAIIEEIIMAYASFTDGKSVHEADLPPVDDSIDVPLVSPLSVTKYTGSSFSSPEPDQPQFVFHSGNFPREIDWDHIISQPSPLEALKEVMRSIIEEDPRCTALFESEEPAGRCRELIDTWFERNRISEYEDCPVNEEIGPASSTWDFVCR
ncbi:hypothetical protein P168DRAFT_33543 [Aspergillus campestris IBT 28561]|uniref:Uncharacterized protein n=1 Tax=Aspergillus campestris (strain IBT 28561) TaxID=1392248 RepID=A0A2I1DHC0_ASPC2|nr:uncharacterized protein P168DRAFT_33543 [Aspergillus campestris IBT 28561]PKY09266.1 hypothetical protein P168DRAFT_33543 [Aspergillus campestris IBT 28561]